MRPLDQKLKYQIDKLVRTAVTGSLCKIFDVLVIDLQILRTLNQKFTDFDGVSSS